MDNKDITVEKDNVAMKDKNTGKSYEELVQEIYQVMLDYNNEEAGYKKINVQHNIQLKGKTGNWHQIDVYWEFSLAGIEYKTLVEVKDWKTPVKMEQINSFKSVLDDIPGFPKGIYVSKNGFQSGAKTTATHHGIDLVVIEPNETQMKILLDNKVTHYDNVEIGIDEEWIKQEEIDIGLLDGLKYNTEQEMSILLNPFKVKVCLFDLMCIDALPYYYEADNISHTIEKKLTGDWFWLTNDSKIPEVKITNYSFHCYNRSAQLWLKIGLPQYIISDLLGQKKHLYDKISKTVKPYAISNGKF